jgi:riboflavin synthase
MFTGIVERTGTVIRVESQTGSQGELEVEVSSLWSDELMIGESVAVNGVCLTLAAEEGGRLCFDVLQETFDRTMLGTLESGDRVNLERALQAGARLGGHVVQGHVDGTGSIAGIESAGADWIVTISCPDSISEYLAYKGSICLNGISLTLASVESGAFKVHIIPHTWKQTSLSQCKEGDSVNLEVDILAKYVRSQLEKGTLPKPPGWEDLGLSPNS